MTDDEISKIFSDPKIVKAAIQAGINAALLNHKLHGNPVCGWRDGKIVWVAPENIKLANDK